MAAMAALLVLTSTAVLTPPVASNDSAGTEHWLVFMQNNCCGIPAFTLFISGATATTGTVSIPGVGFSENFSVTPGAVTTVNLPAGINMTTPDGIAARGVRVTAGADVTVYGLNRVQFTTDAFLGLPTDAIGTSYVVLGWRNVNVVNWSQFAVVATQNDTVVTIVPSVTTGSRTAGVPYDVTLQQGEAYQLANTDAQPADLSGTIVTANKPVSVFGGHGCANIPNNATIACDHLVEQLPSTDTWGRNFVTVPLATRIGGDTFRILAAQDGTQVSINGAPVATLNRGQIHEQLISGESTITATNPVLVAQYSNGTTFDGVTSDPFMMLVPPYEQFLAQYTVTTPASGFRENFINVAVPNAGVGLVTLDGVPIPAGDYTAIGTSGFSAAKLPVALGVHNLAGPVPFGVFVYGFDEADSYGYPGGQSFSPVALVANITLTPPEETILVNTDGCVTARVTDIGGNPLAGIRVDFIVEGVNPSEGFATTDGNGEAVYCYLGANLGTDVIGASVGSLTAGATKTWVETLPEPPAPPTTVPIVPVVTPAFTG